MKLFDGLSARVIRKDVKYIRLRLLPPKGDILISAPFYATDAQLKDFAASKMKWIKDKKYLFAQRAEAQFDPEENMLLWGKLYGIKTIRGKRNGVQIIGENIYVTLNETSSPEDRDYIFKEYRRVLLVEKALELLPHWEKLTGLKCLQLRTRDMKTRWGTCNSAAGRIWLSLNLTQKSLECLNYILLHELIHIKIPNHGADFKAAMGHYMPEWERIKKLLNE
ncbi:MAG: M48 family metallopeptidase [Eubacteriaceae bacterium]|nr:M48 family metallopeptidase [Eubacteriaceae bacterium]